MIKELIPPNLLQDQNIKALAEAIEPEFEKVKQEIINVLIYPRIDELDEQVLDLLAWQFHIEGYELAANITEKRNLIKKAIELHRYKGTRYAIEQVLKALDLEGQINEWFEYGGQPYYFKVDINLKYQGLQSDTYDKLLNLIEEYKNLRSKLEALNIFLTSDFKQNRATATLSGHDMTVYPYQVKEIQTNFGDYRAIGYQAVHTTTVYPQQVTQRRL
ncbi:phage tail protein I [Persephonella sp.]